MPLSVDEKEVALDAPNPVPGLAMKVPLGPQIEEEVDLRTRIHSLLPFTLQMVIPLMSPVTLHLKVNILLGHVGRAALNCPATSPIAIYDTILYTYHNVQNTIKTSQ